MSRQLPPTITSDPTPDWLPIGWISHSTLLKRGRQTMTYTHLRTGKKFYTKDRVLEYIKMVKVREEREYGVYRKKLKASQDCEIATERPEWLPDFSIGSSTMDVNNTSKGFETQSKEEVVLCQNTTESQTSSGEEEETGCNQISYIIEEDEEEFSESEYVKCSRENVDSNITSTLPLRLQPERLQKLKSRAITQCVFEDEDMISDNEDQLPEPTTSKKRNVVGETKVVSNVVESLVEENLRDDKASEIPGLTEPFTIQINLECEPESESLIEKDLNKDETEGVGTRDQDGDLMHINGLSKVVDGTQESGEKSEELLKGHLSSQEETFNESRRSVFFPNSEPPLHSLLVFDNSNARSSTEDFSNNIELPEEMNIITGNYEKGKKNMRTYSSKQREKKDNEAPAKKQQRGKTPTSTWRDKKGSSNVSTEVKDDDDDWPDLCLDFPFEPITARTWRIKDDEDDSVIRKYLESCDSNHLTLPDFGLRSFSNIKISCESERNKSPDSNPCASSSLPSCSSMAATMQHTVAGN
ncbi:unnamed protein product [Cochlearia groenlandica]